MSNFYMPISDSLDSSGDRTSSESKSSYRSSFESNGNGKVKDKKNLMTSITNNYVIKEIIKKINEIYEDYKDYENTENKNYNNPDDISPDNDVLDNAAINEVKKSNAEAEKILNNDLKVKLIEKINTLKLYVETNINEDFIKKSITDSNLLFDLIFIIKKTSDNLLTIKENFLDKVKDEDDDSINSIDEEFIESINNLLTLLTGLDDSINKQSIFNGGVRKRNKTRNIRKIRNSTKKNKKSRKIRKQRKNRRSKRSH